MSIQGSINSIFSSVSSLVAMKKIIGDRQASKLPTPTYEQKVDEAATKKIEQNKFNADVDALVEKRLKADTSLQQQQDSERETRARISGREMGSKVMSWIGDEDGTE